MSFDYFVVLAEMRTGSNFLEASLNSFDDLTCYGELFNPVFVGHHNKDAMFGVDLNAREDNPLELLDKIREETVGTPGFRLFSDHDPRVLEYVLADQNCAKIVLTRNPLDSYVSLKIAAETGQWKLSDMKQRRSAKVSFDDAEYRAHLAARQDFQRDIRTALQRSGQTAFYVDYEEIADVTIINGMARFIGSSMQIDTVARSTKKQNPSSLEEKVANYPAMVRALSAMDHLDAAADTSFEPKRAPGVPGFYIGAATPLLYIPVPSGPVTPVLDWMAGLDGATADDLQRGFSQKDLRQWKRQNPGHRSIAILRHPLARVHRAFCDHVLPLSDSAFTEPRKIMIRKYGVTMPKDGDLTSYDLEDHKVAFTAFLKFLKGNLAGQTSIRVDPVWATQTAILTGAAAVALPDLIIREEEAAIHFSRLAQDLGRTDPVWQPDTADEPFELADIYDAEIEKLCFQAYRKDYITFGFEAWRPDA